MTKKFEAVVDEALALPRRQRERLAERLIDSLPQEERKELERAWSKEIEKRIKDVDEGRVKLIPGEKVLRELKARMRR